MTETSGTRTDSYGTNHLTDNNTVTSAAGPQGNAAHFVKASQEWLSKADNAAVSTGDIDYTIAAWVYMSSKTSTMTIASKYGTTWPGSLEYTLVWHQTYDRFVFIVGNGTTTNWVYADAFGSPPAGQWYYVVAWHNAATNEIGISVNNLVNTASTTISPGDNTVDLKIGSGGPAGEYWDGRIDEVAFYKRVLTPAERAWLYNGGTGRTYADLSSPSPATYTYGDTAHQHAVTSLSTGETYSYDANGNMTCRVENGITYKQEYNIENQLSTMKKMNGTCASGTVLETTSFVYDGDGNLVKKIKPDGSKTLYVGGIYEVDKTSGGTVIQTRTYYPAAGAMRIGSTLYYVLKDHLGSSSVVTDASGNTVGEDRFYPFGQTRLTTGTMYTDRLYTGQPSVTIMVRQLQPII